MYMDYVVNVLGFVFFLYCGAELMVWVALHLVMAVLMEMGVLILVVVVEEDVLKGCGIGKEVCRVEF